MLHAGREMALLKAIRMRIYTFFFALEDPQGLALFRIFFGVLVSLHLAQNWGVIAIWLTDDGAFSLKAAEKMAEPGLDILAWFPSTVPVVQGFILCSLLASFCLTIGYRTRLSAFVVFICATSLDHRNLGLIYGANHIIRICSLILSFSAAGQTLSLDSWQVRRHDLHPEIQRKFFSAWPRRLLQIQTAVIYFVTWNWKILGADWRGGRAVGKALSSGRPLGQWLAQQSSLIPILTYGTLTIEVLLSVALFLPKQIRYFVLGLGLLLHLGIELTMSIRLYQYYMVMLLFTFVDPDDFRKLSLWAGDLLETFRTAYAVKQEGGCA